MVTRDEAIRAAAEGLVDAAVRIETDRAIAAAQRNALGDAGTSHEGEDQKLKEEGPVMDIVTEIRESWKQVTGVRDYREILLSRLAPSDEEFSATHRRLIVSEPLGVQVSNEGNRLKLDHPWVVEVDSTASVLDWQDAGELAASIRTASLYARILNAQAAVSIPGTWTAHRSLATPSGTYIFAALDGDAWVFHPSEDPRWSSFGGFCCGRFAEVAREVVDGVAHTILVSVEEDEPTQVPA